ncbi:MULTISPECIES: hypothetical protein [unclassified Streptomyces]|uniref:hypothetical protein n=1 Tax=unclassified Streptomyces TaxID=2593676 RepID=UPI0022707CCC|nr:MULTISPECIES: hypothetical protein [unclassified Streptomyces]MCY0920837.1 hypothetical protein [Streptomyces sp. H27-G5]MCY0957119.1 hypothetical protein [Streptomyces sp. H27-H5]
MPWITPRPPSVPARTSGFPESAEPAGPRRPSRTPRPSRRSVLVTAVGAGGAALLTGCSDAGDASGAIAEVSLERRMREGAVRDSEELLERYDRTIAAHPDLAGRLTPLRASVAAHPAALAFVDPGRSGERQASPSASATATPAPSGEPVPPKAADALAELADAERSLAETRTVALAGAPGELARLLASVAACGAVHAYLLTSTPGA